ncbi:hypothetical protein EMGBS15_05410 [Filimonas sp.]|nr:hypothetical protein EMGBS15_05410 [Filimonas sp.]
MGRLFLLFMLLVISHSANSQYIGTGSVTQGHATTTIPSIYTCTAGRTPAIGTITASDLTVWTVPAAVHFTDVSFPFASDLYNPCNGHTYSNTAAALAVLNGSDIVTVDADGEVITAFIFADNYFELYVNGIPIGKDNVPYTQFNSNIVRFRAKRPFTIAMQLVDWEEHLGLGAELSGAFAYHDGDGGMVAVFKDATGQIIATTGPDWKAQTFYTAPVTDLTCPTESGSSRLSSNCSNADATDGSNFFGLHWSKPANWMEPTFNDLSWPAATTFSNATVGVNNKSAYTNFTDIFDDVSNDAQFIWSTNLILDNEVIVRHTVNSSLMIPETTTKQSVKIFPNPAQDKLVLIMDRELTESFRNLKFLIV